MSTVAAQWALRINASSMLAYMRALREAKSLAVLIAEDNDKQEYQFHFADDSALRVDQITKRAEVIE